MKQIPVWLYLYFYDLLIFYAAMGCEKSPAPGRRHGEVHGQLCRDNTVSQAADPVRAEKSRHALFWLALRVLRSAAGLLETGLLALDDASISFHQRSKLITLEEVRLEEDAGRLTHSTRLLPPCTATTAMQ